MANREKWQPQLVSSSGDGGAALDQLTSALGLEGGGSSRLGLRLAGQRVQVALVQRERVRGEVRLREDVTAVTLTVKFDGVRESPGDEAPSIVLRREQQADVREKERGLTVEVQTGYAGFDHAVFIDNDSSEADVRRILAKEATRQAVLRLLEAGHTAVRISTTGVTVKHPVGRGGVVAAEPALDALEDLLIIARAGGPRDAAPSRRGQTLLGIAVGGCTAALGYGCLAWAAWPTTLWVAGIGAVVGAVVAVFSRPAIEAACSGDSSSGKRAAAVVALLSTASGALTFGALEHLNGALDGSAGQAWRGVVTSVSTPVVRSRRDRDRGRERDPLTRTAVVRWADGSTSRISTDSSVQEGDHVDERRYPGALGFPWHDQRQFSRR